MARPNLTSPQQPIWLRLLLNVYQSLASLKLAVVVISGSAIVLAWATYIDSKYGHESKAVQFGIYGTAWFAGMIFLLGLNVLCAATIRFPWKRYQTGFVITHLGILVLLVGCWLSRRGGIDAQMPIYEGTSSYRAFADTQHIRLKVRRYASDADAKGSSVAADENVDDENTSGRRVELIDVPFEPGPFNWDDYGTKLFWFPWQLSHRDRGVLFDEDGIRLEAIDYYSDAQVLAAKPLVLQVRTEGRDHSAKSSDGWTRVELAVRQQGDMAAHPGEGRVARHPLPSGQQIVFRVAGSLAETEAFLASSPKGDLGKKGQLVLWASGETFRYQLDELQPGQRVPLGSLGLEMELTPPDPQAAQLDLAIAGLLIHAPGERPRKMRLVADVPEFDEQDEEHGVFGSYWVDRTAEQPAGQSADNARVLGRPRIDILQGPDGALYYRAWKSSRVETVGPMPADRGHVSAFAGTPEQLRWVVEEFVPHDRPGVQVTPAKFTKHSPQSKTRCVRLRLTVDGRSEEFWLEGLPAVQFDEKLEDNQRKVVFGDGRRVEASLAWDAIDVGFRIFLHDFDRRLDPGTSMASHYGSVVDFRDRKNAGELLVDQNFHIVLNEPVNFVDPGTGRSYRLYQESFNGPWKPGDVVFNYVHQKTGVVPETEQLFSSTITVNYDPGRGLKYAGSLLVVAGVATMFYMRAYFFRRRPGSAEHESNVADGVAAGV